MIISIFLFFDVTGTIVGLGEHKTYYAKQIERLNIIQYADKSKPEIVLKTIDIAPYPIAPIDARLL